MYKSKLDGVDPKLNVEPHSFIIFILFCENVPGFKLYGFPVVNPHPKFEDVFGLLIAF